MRLPPKPLHAPKHREERLKLAASGLQALALTLFGAVLIAPALNPSLTAPLWERAAAMLLIGAAETLAFFLLRYIPATPAPEEPTP